MRLSLLDECLVVQSHSIGGKSHDVDHDDERLRWKIHALDSLHHVQDFTENGQIDLSFNHRNAFVFAHLVIPSEA